MSIVQEDYKFGIICSCSLAERLMARFLNIITKTRVSAISRTRWHPASPV